MKKTLEEVAHQESVRQGHPHAKFALKSRLPLLLEGRRFDGRFLFEGDAMLDYALEVRPL